MVLWIEMILYVYFVWNHNPKKVFVCLCFFLCLFDNGFRRNQSDLGDSLKVSVFLTLSVKFYDCCKTKLECGKRVCVAPPSSQLDKSKEIISVQLQEERILSCDLISNQESCWRAASTPKAVTVFSIGSLRRFKPFNGSFHLKALVGVLIGVCRGFCACVCVVSCLSRWIAALWRPILVAAHQQSPWRSSPVLCSDWTLMKHFVLPHCVFTCHSDTCLPIRCGV